MPKEYRANYWYFRNHPTQDIERQNHREEEASVPQQPKTLII
jgi:hypothetical protein